MLERRDGRWARLPHADLQWRMGWGKECERLCAGCATAGRNCRWRLISVNWGLGTAFGGFGQQAAGSQARIPAGRAGAILQRPLPTPLAALTALQKNEPRAEPTPRPASR